MDKSIVDSLIVAVPKKALQCGKSDPNNEMVVVMLWYQPRIFTIQQLFCQQHLGSLDRIVVNFSVVHLLEKFLQLLEVIGHTESRELFGETEKLPTKCSPSL